MPVSKAEAAAPPLNQIKITINAKCLEKVRKENNKALNNACLGKGKFANKPNEAPQAANRLIAICGHRDTLTKHQLYGKGGTVNGGNCNRIKANQDLKTLAQKASVTAVTPTPGESSSPNEPKRPKSDAPESCANPGFFSLPTWYKYLGREVDVTTGRCEVKFSLFVYGNAGREFSGVGLLLIALSIVDMLLRIAALAAVAFVIFGGIKYTTSQGSPDSTKAAQSTILNALVGLVIAMVATAVVMFIGNRIA